MADEWLELPQAFHERVAVDKVGRIVYVDRRHAGDPLLLTWVERNRVNGVHLTITPTDVDEVVKMRSNGMRVVEEADIDMVVRASAIELIRTAAAYKASDIHLMMRGTHTEIQAVINGGLRVMSRRTQLEGENLARAIYQGIAKTRDSSFNTLERQNAQIPGDALPPDTGLTSIRIVRGPAYPQAQGGAFMTLRLQYGATQIQRKPGDLARLELPRRPEGNLRLGGMGYTNSNIEKLRILMDSPNGVVIFTGPTGSGKTTAMYESLQDIARTKPERRLVTIEDPVEYPMAWAVQMAVTDTHNEAQTAAKFEEYLRVALRMAPNAILLGELRDPGVAVAALQAAVTGHQVWTTLHVTDPFLFVERLELMDGVRLARRVFCDHKIVRGVVAQRLLPQLCPKCSVFLREQPTTLSKRIVSALSTWGDLNRVRVKGPGCPNCDHDGTTGRFAVAEVVVTDARLMSDFINEGSEVARSNYRAKPGADLSMMEAAIAYALSGVIDPRSVEDCVDLIEPKLAKGGPRIAAVA